MGPRDRRTASGDDPPRVRVDDEKPDVSCDECAQQIDEVRVHREARLARPTARRSAATPATRVRPRSVAASTGGRLDRRPRRTGIASRSPLASASLRQPCPDSLPRTRPHGVRPSAACSRYRTRASARLRSSPRSGSQSDSAPACRGACRRAAARLTATTARSR